MSIKGTETEKNLLKAFAGESQARNRYTYFASQARKDGYEHIADIFIETAEQERVHAKQFFKFLEGGPLEITATYPAGIILSTKENLKGAAEGENEEWSILYPGFAKIAKDEGFPEIAQTFTAICVAEKQHEKRYRGFLQSIEDGSIFDRPGATWRCRHCGFVVTANGAPEKCPACKHPRAYFEILAENW